MLNFIDGFKSRLTTNLRTTGDTIKLPPKAVQQLNALAENDHVYLTVRYLDRYEVVKFTKGETDIKGDEVPVERDILEKGRKNFPCEACVTIDWNSVQLKEFICQNKEC